MEGLGIVGVADALADFLAARFPDFYVYRSYLGLDGADAAAAKSAGKAARIAVIPESFSFDPASRGRLGKQSIVRVVVWKDFGASTTDEATFAPPAEVDPLVGTLEEIAELFTERTRVLTANGRTVDAYIPESRLATDAPLYDEELLLNGKYVGSLRVAVFEKLERKTEDDGED